ncbi:MAG: glutathione S-transferase, partial [Proteobacteria bacterium]|nr:glutathione S-transferase [Pseudomonadota bacterium]
MADISVYGPPQSTYLRTVRMALEEKTVPYELVDVEFGSEAHRALHPFLKVPAFKHGDVHLYETAAIGYYVNATFDGISLTPSDTLGRAHMLGWISSTVDYIYPTGIVDVVQERVVVPMRGGTTDEDKISAAKPKLTEQLDVVEKAL